MANPLPLDDPQELPEPGGLGDPPYRTTEDGLVWDIYSPGWGPGLAQQRRIEPARTIPRAASQKTTTRPARVRLRLLADRRVPV